jgi:hypothetical protein
MTNSPKSQSWRVLPIHPAAELFLPMSESELRGLGEVFVGNHRCDSHADSCAKDAAILASIALQFGAPLDVLRKALLRDSQGRPSTPIGIALDLLAERS